MWWLPFTPVIPWEPRPPVTAPWYSTREEYLRGCENIAWWIATGQTSRK